MASEFDIAPDSIGLEKHLFDDLQLDSLDTVDLILILQDRFDKKIDPALFKDAGTVEDAVNLLLSLWK